MRVLITGGTGTLGYALVEALNDCDITVISRNEVKQVEMSRRFINVKYLICDVKEYKALKRICKWFDRIYHLAALKHVPVCEKQPLEAIKTNVYGTLNLVRASEGIPIIFMSTDKAENPSSVYGNTKAIAESIILNSGNTVVRTGNIFGSSGSVIPMFVNQIKTSNTLTLTDGNMTRFFISAQELANFLVGLKPGGIKFPEMKSYRMDGIAETAKKMYGNKFTQIKYIGIRTGEKMHESLGGKSSLDCLGTQKDLDNLFNTWNHDT